MQAEERKLMKDQNYRRYYIFVLLLVALLSAYPIYMGIHVLVKMMQDGLIPKDEYPKYVIPYTPIAVALIAGVLLIPVLQAIFKKLDFVIGLTVSVGIFFVCEHVMETKVLVQTTKISLASWQMSLCYVPPEGYQTRTWEAVDVLLGGYNPAFKLHFYLISVVLIAALLNCFYGFSKMIRTRNYGRKKALILQAVAAVIFLAMCIWACFTAFYRTGELIVSPISASLMMVFFALLGVTMGLFAGSFALGKKKLVSVIIPSGVAMAVTIVMYVGETILLNGNLYRFGKGFLFQGMGKAVVAPADVLVILASGAITLLICQMVNREKIIHGE